MDKEKFILINHFLVEVDESVKEEKTKAGIFIPATQRDKVPNYGVVLKTPDVVLLKDFEQKGNWWKRIEVGDIVFFPVNVSLNNIEFSNAEPGKKYLLVPVDIIQAVYKVGDGDDE